MEKHIDNSVTISGGNNQGSIFAAGSKDFKGTINNISKTDIDKTEELTKKLVDALQLEQNIEGTNAGDIINAIQQVEIETKKDKINKISLQGILSGVDMVMQSVRNISASATSLYSEWSTHIHTITSSL